MHASLNACGGAERVCIAMINALREAGHTVTLATVDKTNWVLLKKRYGLACSPDREMFIIPNPFQTASNPSRAVLTLVALLSGSSLLKVKGKHDLVINTSGEIIDLMSDIVYVNAIPARMAHSFPDILPTKNVRWFAFSSVFDTFLRALDKLHSNSLFITNSKFNKNIIAKCCGQHALVLYPPVDVTEFAKLYKNKRRKNLVVAIARLRKGKNLESVVRIAQLTENVKFLIVGPSDKASETTLMEINELAVKLNAREKVQLLTNAPMSVLFQTLSEAKILLHTQSSEAFGMAIVEAMSAGCVPVVPRNGGPWLDILDQEQGKYGYSYGNIGEATEIIEMLVLNEELRAEVSERAHVRATYFERSTFENKIRNIVKEFEARKLKH